jgi:hypothetical protein
MIEDCVVRDVFVVVWDNIELEEISDCELE